MMLKVPQRSTVPQKMTQSSVLPTLVIPSRVKRRRQRPNRIRAPPNHRQLGSKLKLEKSLTCQVVELKNPGQSTVAIKGRSLLLLKRFLCLSTQLPLSKAKMLYVRKLCLRKAKMLVRETVLKPSNQKNPPKPRPRLSTLKPPMMYLYHHRPRLVCWPFSTMMMMITKRPHLPCLRSRSNRHNQSR